MRNAKECKLTYIKTSQKKKKSAWTCTYFQILPNAELEVNLELQPQTNTSKEYQKMSKEFEAPPTSKDGIQSFLSQDTVYHDFTREKCILVFLTYI